jgi:4-methyl-5(b-hydroxyethyl)-thiazole monophosphate biosynthesis
MAKRALIVLAEGFEEIEAVAPIDVMTRVGIDVVVASLTPPPVKAAYGTTLMSDCTLSEVEGEFDAIICPGGKANAKALAADSLLREKILEFNERGALVAAICAAPSHILGESAGILSGRHATGDPGFTEKLAESGAILEKGPVCIDGNLITATGPGSAMSFALSVAAYLVGDDLVEPFSKKWEIDYSRVA